jgi:hypothetical protein
MGSYMDPLRMQELSSMFNGKETRTYIRPVVERMGDPLWP